MGDRNSEISIIDSKVERLLMVFFKNKDKFFHLGVLSKQANVANATTFRLIKKLVGCGMINVIKIGKFKLYKLNENKKTRLFEKIIETKI